MKKYFYRLLIFIFIFTAANSRLHSCPAPVSVKESADLYYKRNNYYHNNDYKKALNYLTNYNDILKIKDYVDYFIIMCYKKLNDKNNIQKAIKTFFNNKKR